MKPLVSLTVALGALAAGAAVSGATQRYVISPGGSDDHNDCSSSLAPCLTIQAGVNQASSGDTILVAEGTYRFVKAQDTISSCTATVGEAAVVCVLDRVLTIRGGYPTGSWSVADPVGHPSVIDGQAAQRGILVEQHSPSASPAGLTMSGFTVSSGRAQIPTGDSTLTAFGGGLKAVGTGANVPVLLQQMIFSNNVAQGGNNGSGSGGPGAGGAVALVSIGTGSTLDRVTFSGNTAQGGTGAGSSVRGGYGQGGGIFTFQSTVTGTYLTFTSNSALGGSTSGDGRDGGGATADGLGGAVAAEKGSNVTLTNLLASGNIATGGNATTHAGSGLGAALFAELATLSATLADLRGNTAMGGNASTGGLAGGGGVMTAGGSLTLQQSYVINNQALGGNGTIDGFGAGGGAVYFNGNGSAQLTNDILADNLAQLGTGTSGGGGGAAFLQGATCTFTHVTMAHNALGAGLIGQAAVLVGSGNTLTLNDGLVANHAGSGAALYVQSGSTLTLNTGLFAANTQDTTGDSGSTINGSFATAVTAGFHALGSPHFDYHLDLGSHAIDLATGSSTPVDIDGESRPHTADGTAAGGVADVGADEFVVPTHLFNDGFEFGNLLRWSTSVP